MIEMRWLRVPAQETASVCLGHNWHSVLQYRTGEWVTYMGNDNQNRFVGKIPEWSVWQGVEMADNEGVE